MKTIIKNKSGIKKAFGIAALCLGLNGTIKSQCNAIANFTYTTTNSSINATSTSTGAGVTANYEWYPSAAPDQYHGGGQYNGTIADIDSLYNGTYTLYLTVWDSGCVATSATQTITITGGVNPPPCSSSFTYTIGANGLVNFTNTSPSDPYNNTNYTWFFDDSINPSLSFNQSTVSHTFYNGTYNVSLGVSNSVSSCTTTSTQTITISNGSPVPPCNANFNYTVGANGQVSFSSLYTGPQSSIKWSLGDGTSVNDTSMITHTYFNGTYIVTSSINFASSNCYSSDTITITNGLPMPLCNAAFTYTTGANGNVTFSSLSSNTYSLSTGWNWGDGTGILAGGNFTSHTYTYNGTYLVSSYVTNANLTSDTCSSMDTIVVTNALPIPVCNSNFTYTVGAGGNLTLTSLFSGSPNNIYWYFGDGSSIIGYDSSNIATHNYIYNGTYIVTSTINNYNPSLSCTTTDTIFITTGLPIPACNAAFTYTMEPNGNIFLASLYNGGNLVPGVRNTWSISNGLTLYGSYINYTFPSNGTYTVTLAVTDSANTLNCSTSQVIIISNDSPSVCQAYFIDSLSSNGGINFLSQCSGTTANTIYSWNFGDGNLSSSMSPFHTFANNGTYIVSLQITDSTTNCSSNYKDTIVVNTSPCNAIVGFNYTLGSNGQISFRSITSNLPAGAIYNWNFGDGYTSSAIAPIHTFNYNGIYSVCLIVSDSANNCSNGSCDSVVITNANSAPCAPSISFYMYNVDSLNNVVGDTMDIAPYYSSQVSNAIWYWGDGSYTTGLYPSHTFSAAGEYSVCVTVYASCGDSSTTCQNDSIYRIANHKSVSSTMIAVNVINTHATTGIETHTQQTAQVSVYPNPSTGIFKLQLNSVSDNVSTVQINVTNILGEIIYSSEEQISNNCLSKEIDLQNADNGAYFMKVSIGDKTYTSKTIISK